MFTDDVTFTAVQTQHVDQLRAEAAAYRLARQAGAATTGRPPPAGRGGQVGFLRRWARRAAHPSSARPT